MKEEKKMWVAENWKDYEILDTSEGEKLEKWGEYVLVRPDPQVIWDTPKGYDWKKINAHYHRSHEGGGSWEFINLPEVWKINYGKLTFALKPFSFKHTGLFPEQAVNWDWMTQRLQNAIINRRNSENAEGNSEPIKVLNLFAYTGGATCACALAGHKEGTDMSVKENYQVSVTHVDASKGMVGWAKENAALSGMENAPIRWIVDDCVKFVEREIRRGNHYDAILMDPPSYGRGPKGETWKNEECIFNLVKLCMQLMSDKPVFFLINAYTTGLAPAVLKYMLGITMEKKYGGVTLSEEIGLRVKKTGLVLPEGASGRWTTKE